MSSNTTTYREQILLFNILAQKYMRASGRALDILETGTDKRVILSCCDKCQKFETCFTHRIISHKCEDACALLAVVALLINNMSRRGNEKEANEFITKLNVSKEIGDYLFRYIVIMSDMIKDKIIEKYFKN